MNHDLGIYHGEHVCLNCTETWPVGYTQFLAQQSSDCSHNLAPLLVDFEEIKDLRIAFTDGEMSNLQADFGQLLCACIVEYKPPTKESREPWTNLQTLTLDDYKHERWNDKGLAVRWRNALEKFDIIVTWNGIKFDIPFLNTRLRRWKQRELRSPKHKDLMYTARYKLRLHDAKLDTVAKFLGVRTSKTRMEPERWTMAMGGHAPSYEYIVDHCQRDVKVLAGSWEKLKHLIGEIK